MSVNMIGDSFTSQMMSAVLTWRNPFGKQEDWDLNPEAFRASPFPSPIRMIAAHACFVVIAGLAVIETVARIALLIIAQSINCFVNIKDHIVTLKETVGSSVCTIMWTSASIWMHVYYPNMPTKEKLAWRHITLCGAEEWEQ